MMHYNWQHIFVLTQGTAIMVIFLINMDYNSITDCLSICCTIQHYGKYKYDFTKTNIHHLILKKKLQYQSLKIATLSNNEFLSMISEKINNSK